MKKFRYIIMKLAYPFLRLIGKIHMPYSHKKMSGTDYYVVKERLKKGHVFITVTYGELTNKIIPGKWSHGAIYAGIIDGIPQVVEAVGIGVVVRPLVDFLLEKDLVRVLEPTFCSDAQMALAADEAIKQAESGAVYDYEFVFSIPPKNISSGDAVKYVKVSHHAFYCVELLMWSYMVIVEDMPFKLRKRWGEPEVTADDFANATKHWVCVWDKKLNGTED